MFNVYFIYSKQQRGKSGPDICIFSSLRLNSVDDLISRFKQTAKLGLVGEFNFVRRAIKSAKHSKDRVHNYSRGCFSARIYIKHHSWAGVGASK